jgi:hypothetical protein
MKPPLNVPSLVKEGMGRSHLEKGEYYYDLVRQAHCDVILCHYMNDSINKLESLARLVRY